MGAWETGPFDNDDATDWLYELEESSSSSLISAALEAVEEVGDDYLEAPESSTAIAAAEIIAALRGFPLPSLPESAKEWVENNQELDISHLVDDAIAIVRRIRTESELKDLWEESDDAPKWFASLDDLIVRLKTQ